NMELLQDPHFWVTVSFLLLIALAIRPVWSMMTKGLDGRSARIASELNEARRLRVEAAKILADYQRRQAEVVREASEILEKTRADAARLAETSRKDLESALEKRSQAAMEKIAQAEAKAVEEVKNHM